MNYWSEASQANLLPLSKEQSDFKVALKEWEHRGIAIDHLYPVETCQLCDHANLRYHFEIVNHETRATLQIGSSCIEKFGIRVYDEEGKKMESEAVGKQLREEINAKKEEIILEPLRKLWKAREDSQNKVQKYVQEYQEHGGFSPQNLAYLFKEMREEKISFVPHLYKITLRRRKDRDDLFRMPKEDKDFIWSSLSISQKKRYIKGKNKFDEELKRKQEGKKVREEKKYPPSKKTTLKMPIHYAERAHKYKIIFFDNKGKPLARLFRGNLKEIRALVKEKVAEDDDYTKTEIRITLTNKLVEIYP